MEETIDKKIERLLDDEKIKEIIATAGKGEVAPVTRASNLIEKFIHIVLFIMMEKKLIQIL